MSTPNPKQSAFPLPEYATGDERRGMTKREYFSLMIYQSLINAHYLVPETPHTASDSHVAVLAVQQADKLLEILEK